ncbi:hypothetical protein YA0059_11910 [Pseudomonas syringae]|nr:hypothetical protein [Pseudomonas syringae]MBI6786390.1 hypothetical protein [Pseudomonas syringae]
MKQQGQRDRAILAVLLYHEPRREEAVLLQVSDIQERCGIQHLKGHGKGGKVRCLPLHPVAAGRIHQYLESSGHHLADGKYRSLYRCEASGRVPASRPTASTPW